MVCLSPQESTLVASDTRTPLLALHSRPGRRLGHRGAGVVPARRLRAGRAVSAKGLRLDTAVATKPFGRET